MLKDPPEGNSNADFQTDARSRQSRFEQGARLEGPILIAVVFFSDSIEAVRQAYTLNRSFKQPVCLLHVIIKSKKNLQKKKAKQRKIERRKRDLAADKMARFLRINGIHEAFKKDDIALQTSVAWGEPLAAILLKAEEIQSGLIVMGCGRHAGPSSNLLGNTTERVLRLAHRPVMVVKSPLVQAQIN